MNAPLFYNKKHAVLDQFLVSTSVIPVKRPCPISQSMKVETITANKQQIEFRNFPQQQQSRNLMQSLVHVVSALTQNYLVLRTKLGN